MPNKRKRDNNSSERIQRKIRKLESQLEKRSKQFKRLIVYSDSENEESESPQTENVRISQSASPLLSPTPSLSPTSVDTPASREKQRAFPLEVTPQTSVPLEVAEQAAIPLEVDLDCEILAALGEAPKAEEKFGKPTYKDLASRWQNILEKGLSKESKDKIYEEYLIPDNCRLLLPPTLNPEVKVALAENIIKRDLSLSAKQKQISIAIAALNKAIEMSISKEDHTKILKSISDACRLLCDSHCIDTRTRRGFIISSINPDLKETLIETKRDSTLFGEDVSEKLKTAKLMKRSAADLKQVRNERSQTFNKTNFIKPNKNTTNNRLNWKTMPRKITPKLEAVRFRQNQRPATTSYSQQRGHRETSEQSAATTSNRRR